MKFLKSSNFWLNGVLPVSITIVLFTVLLVSLGNARQHIRSLNNQTHTIAVQMVDGSVATYEHMGRIRTYDDRVEWEDSSTGIEYDFPTENVHIISDPLPE